MENELLSSSLEEERRKYTARIVFGSDVEANAIRTEWENLKETLDGNLQKQLDEIYDALLMAIPPERRIKNFLDVLPEEKREAIPQKLSAAIERFRAAKQENFDQNI